MLYNRLRSGEDFDMLARRYSEDPETKNNGGDLGFAPESSLRSTDPATREAVLKLKDGQFSAPVPVVNPDTKQIFGYRIVKVIAKEPAGQRELSDPRVQQAIREQLRGTREQLLKAAYYEVVRNDAKVENYFAQQVLKTTTEQK
jgi:peptidyl-prolyl cis-trans isomerase SurA